MPCRILVPTDFSAPADAALSYARLLARTFDASLHLLHVTDPPSTAPGATADRRDRVPATLRELRDRLTAEDRSPDVAVLAIEAPDTAREIVQTARSMDASLIVMGTHGRRGFKRLLLGSVTEAVLREAPCPVLTVPPYASAGVADAATFKRILCPIDFSPSALQALGFALDLARQADGRVTLFHVIEWLAEEEPRASTHFNVPEYRRYMVQDAQERLRNLVAEESRTWVEIDDEVVFGRAHREILRAAETKPANLIVMGAQGRGGIGLALFGSTTQQIVRGSTCPVLTVRGLRQT